jgi:heme exporter protein D
MTQGVDAAAIAAAMAGIQAKIAEATAEQKELLAGVAAAKERAAELEKAAQRESMPDLPDPRLQPPPFRVETEELDSFDKPLTLRDLVRVLRHPRLRGVFSGAQISEVIVALVEDARAEKTRAEVARELDHATPAELDALRDTLMEARSRG